MDWSSENIRKLVNCCACGGKIGRRINMVCLSKRARWKYPIAGNVITGVSDQAVAIVCDPCIDGKREIQNAVEIDGEQVKYHPVETLETMAC